MALDTGITRITLFENSSLLRTKCEKFNIMDWENLRAFALLARHQTLSAAGRAAGVEHATIGRRIVALEAELGMKLLDRRGRRVQMTHQGERIALIAQRMEDEALTILRVAAGAQEALAGEVTISAPPAYAQAVLFPKLMRLRRDHPKLNLVVLGEKREASLARREADIAVRMTRPVAGDLLISKIDEVSFGFFATASYLDGVSAQDWQFVSYDREMEAAPQTRLSREFAAGRVIAFQASSLEMQLEAVLAGVGIAILPEFLTRGRDELVRVPTNLPLLKREVWLVVHPDMSRVPAIRAAMQALSAHEPI